MYNKLMYVLISLGVVSLAGIIFVAVSRKSGLKHRVAALAALALMIITVIICLFQIFGMSVSEEGTDYSGMPPSSVPASQESNTGIMIAFIIFMILLFMVVLLLSIREHRHSKAKLDP